jgi:hypothetical protein
VALIKENEGSGRGCVKLKEAVYGKMNSENSYRQFLTYAKVFNPRLSYVCWPRSCKSSSVLSRIKDLCKTPSQAG